jgi:DNA-binding MarR family transcriptional regulator
MAYFVNKVYKKTSSVTLYQLLAGAHAWFEKGLMDAFRKKKMPPLGKADLNLLANLNCGSTYSSELAKRLGVTRQAVTKLLRNLIELELVKLETVPERRNTKEIVITPKGQDIIMAAVDELNRLEKKLAKQIGKEKASALRDALECDWNA